MPITSHHPIDLIGEVRSFIRMTWSALQGYLYDGSKPSEQFVGDLGILVLELKDRAECLEKELEDLLDVEQDIPDDATPAMRVYLEHAKQMRRLREERRIRARDKAIAEAQEAIA